MDTSHHVVFFAGLISYQHTEIRSTHSHGSVVFRI